MELFKEQRKSATLQCHLAHGFLFSKKNVLFLPATT